MKDLPLFQQNRTSFDYLMKKTVAKKSLQRSKLNFTKNPTLLKIRDHKNFPIPPSIQHKEPQCHRHVPKQKVPFNN